MILALKNGKLIPPKTPAAGHKRALVLAGEIARIEEQIKDPKRVPASAADWPAYDRWRHSAQQALRMHNLELRLLTEWLEAQGARLMRKTVLLLEALIKDEVEFDDEERALIDELTAYVRAREVP